MTHQPVAGFGREKRPGDVGSPSPPPQVVQAPMTANDNSDGDRIEVPDEGGPIELGSVTSFTYEDGSLHLDEPAERTYEVIAYPIDHAEDERFGVGIREVTQFEGGNIHRDHSLSPEQARELAARLTAAADKLGHVPDDDAPQPAEL